MQAAEDATDATKSASEPYLVQSEKRGPSASETASELTAEVVHALHCEEFNRKAGFGGMLAPPLPMPADLAKEPPATPCG